MNNDLASRLELAILNTAGGSCSNDGSCTELEKVRIELLKAGNEYYRARNESLQSENKVIMFDGAPKTLYLMENGDLTKEKAVLERKKEEMKDHYEQEKRKLLFENEKLRKKIDIMESKPDQFRELPPCNYYRLMRKEARVIKKSNEKIEEQERLVHSYQIENHMLRCAKRGESVNLEEEPFKEIKTVIIGLLRKDLDLAQEEIEKLKAKMLKSLSSDSLQKEIAILKAEKEIEIDKLESESRDLRKLVEDLLNTVLIQCVVINLESECKVKLVNDLQKAKIDVVERSEAVKKLMKEVVEAHVANREPKPVTVEATVAKEQSLKNEPKTPETCHHDGDNKLVEVVEEQWDWGYSDHESTTSSPPIVTEAIKKQKKEKKSQWKSMVNGKEVSVRGFDIFNNEAPMKNNTTTKKSKKSKKSKNVAKSRSVTLSMEDNEEQEVALEEVMVESQILEAIEDAVNSRVEDSDDEDEDHIKSASRSWVSYLYWFFFMIFVGLIFRVIV